MARKTNQSPPPQQPAKLRIPRNRARDMLVSRYNLGVPIRDREEIRSEEDLTEARAERDKWSDYNRELLRRIFSNDEYETSYNSSGWGRSSISFGGAPTPLFEKVEQFREMVQGYMNFLESLAERIDLIEEDAGVGEADVDATPPPARRVRQGGGSRRVFVVHGRDDEVKAIVARFLEHCDLEPIILHEQPDKGRTIIEKFEDSSDVGFAVILLTPDDIGALKGEGSAPDWCDRARQNVILEMGFFLGSLGRERVFALTRGELELPSDYAGVIYTPFDASEGWKLKLARELKVVGIDVDMNKVLV